MKVRKKTVIVDAIKWTGERDVVLQVDEMCDCEMYLVAGTNDLVIRTLEGDMKANIGDWIIRGVNGECYPIKTEIFEKTYEEVTNV